MKAICYADVKGIQREEEEPFKMVHTFAYKSDIKWL